VEDAEGEAVGAHILPDVFDRMQCGTAGALGQKRAIVGHGEGFAAVPNGAIEDRNRNSARPRHAGGFGEIGVHRGGVDERQRRNQRLCRG